MKAEDARVFIAIPVHNRRRIVAQCIPTVIEGLYPLDALAIYEDGSDDVDMNALKFWTELPGDELHLFKPSIGIERQRRRHFLDFWHKVERGYGFTHLYLTDSDALHDPNWRRELLRLQNKYDGDPICGYNTDAHVRLAGNTEEDDPREEVIVRRVAPGISYLLTVEHVKKVIRALPMLPEHWNWDWTVPAILGNRMLITRKSVVDHIGLGGYHHPANEGLDGGDRALNPTEWLVNKRKKVVAVLSHDT